MFAPALHAQTRPAAVDVFLDCQTQGCDSEHFRNEIRFVNWVRDREVADVHLLVTSQNAGGGGSVYQLTFIGLRAFAGDSSTLRLDVEQNMTSAERRDALTNRIAQGLLRYAARTAAADRIRIEFGDEEEEERRPRAGIGLRDPWNFWVFSISLDGSVDGESREETQAFDLNLDASRTTEAWKIELEARGSLERQRIELRERTIRRDIRNYEIEALAVKCLAPAWSAGLETSAGRSTFQNQDFYARIAPVLEYSFFPYEEFSRRQMTLQYSIGAARYDYLELTIFNRLEEQRYDQELDFTLRYRQPWGSAEFSLSGSHYLHDINRYRASADGSIDVRLFRGFTLELNAGYERVHDQLFIPQEEDVDDILLQLQELETNYRYDVSIGIQYTFGSIYNNIVNPRIRRGRGRDFDDN